MWSTGAWWYLAGWAIGWLLFWRLRPLPAMSPAVSRVARPGVAVVIPARDEAPRLRTLVPVLAAQLRPGDELVVVDDASADDTADVAAAAGARVIAAQPLAQGWRGKTAACAVGAAATSAPVLLFVDADVQPPVDLLDRIGAASASYPGAVVSVQPWHAVERAYEQCSVIPNIVALMGAPARQRRWASAPMGFGPVLAVRREVYDGVGGHGHPDVRGASLEDTALARVVGASEVFTGRPDIRFRMHPDGWRDMFRGWVRNMGGGARLVPWWAMLGVIAWVWSLAGGLFATPVAYPLTALQVWVMGRRVGRFAWWTALLYPVAVAVFVAMLLRAAWLRLRGGSVAWKGRDVAG